MRLGIILPSFAPLAKPSIERAREAEGEGIHGVFAYHHLWPMGFPGQPAIEPFVLLGCVANETSELILGTLVARIGLVPDTVLIGEFRTLSAVSGGRMIAGIGTGDHLSANENRSYGIAFARAEERRNALRQVAATLRGDGIEVWIGGGAPATNAIARETGSTLNLFDRPPEAVAASAPFCPVSWAGPLPPRESSATELVRAVAESGATWLVVSSFSTAVSAVTSAARSAEVDLGW